MKILLRAYRDWLVRFLYLPWVLLHFESFAVQCLFSSKAAHWKSRCLQLAAFVQKGFSMSSRGCLLLEFLKGYLQRLEIQRFLYSWKEIGKSHLRLQSVIASFALLERLPYLLPEMGWYLPIGVSRVFGISQWVSSDPLKLRASSTSSLCRSQECLE